MLSVSKYQHGLRKIEVTYVPVNSVVVISSSGVIYAIITNNDSVALQYVAKVDTRCR